ncbi:MAG TPA: protein phosphatase 2C domain-containing protein [Mycobacteriales bacterium]|nr:protein phosphatase 2C domain-containing protein [Mycobacteriales bacterium]
MTLVWQYAVRSEVGLVRSGNEDSAFAGQRLIAVADGMGGHAAGEVASAATIAALARLDERVRPGWDAPDGIRRAVRSANATLRDIVAADSELHGMGTTVTAAMIDGTRLVLAHVGDSRAYRLRDGAMEQLTRDHTYVQQLVDEGRLRREEVSTHPQRNVITRSLDGRADLDIDIAVERAVPGDRYLVCSDGLSGVVSDDTLARSLAAGTPAEVVDALVDLALRAGGPDNITCIVADVADSAGASDGPGQVVGAADDSAVMSRSLPPAGAAAVAKEDLGDGPAAPPPPQMPAAAARAPSAEPDRDDPRRRAQALRRRRGWMVAAGSAALLGVGAAAGWAVVRSQYYVGAESDRVAIFRGVQGSVLGIDLSSVHSTSEVMVSSLPDFARTEVAAGIHADGLSDAEEIVDRLRANALDSRSGLPCAPAGSPRTVAPTTAPAPSSSPQPLGAPSVPTPPASCSPRPLPAATGTPSISPAAPS